MATAIRSRTGRATRAAAPPWRPCLRAPEQLISTGVARGSDACVLAGWSPTGRLLHRDREARQLLGDRCIVEHRGDRAAPATLQSDVAKRTITSSVARVSVSFGVDAPPGGARCGRNPEVIAPGRTAAVNVDAVDRWRTPVCIARSTLPSHSGAPKKRGAREGRRRKGISTH